MLHSEFFSAPQTWFPDFRHNSQDVTAILAVYSPDGFVIGADGQCVTPDGRTLCNNTQKVFVFQNGAIRLAYAWAGSVEQFNDKDERIFDLRQVSEGILSSPENTTHKSPCDFTAWFRDSLRNTLYTSKATCRKRLHNSVPNDELAKLLIVGYCNEAPFLSEICVRHLATVVTEPTISMMHFPLSPGTRYLFSGSKSVWETFTNRAVNSLHDSVPVVHDYIKACADSSDRDCDGIGGRVHVAKVTSETIAWPYPPAPKSGD